MVRRSVQSCNKLDSRTPLTTLLTSGGRPSGHLHASRSAHFNDLISHVVVSPVALPSLGAGKKVTERQWDCLLLWAMDRVDSVEVAYIVASGDSGTLSPSHLWGSCYTTPSLIVVLDEGRTSVLLAIEPPTVLATEPPTA